MSDTAEQGEERAAEWAGEGSAEGTGEASAQLRRARRTAAYRGARRVLSRPGFRATIRERLALLEDASRLYDLDESVDMYGDGIVAALEERVAGLLGMEAAAFFPTGTMAQQVALRC